VSVEFGLASTPLWDNDGKKLDNITFCAPQALQMLLQQQGVGNFDTLIDTVLTPLAKARCIQCQGTIVRSAFANYGTYEGCIEQILLYAPPDKCVKIKWSDGDITHHGFKQTLSFAITARGLGCSDIKGLRFAERAVNVCCFCARPPLFPSSSSLHISNLYHCKSLWMSPCCPDLCVFCVSPW